VSTVPTPITVYHQVWTATGEKDAHGNATFYLAPSVPRKVQAINEFGRRGSSHEIVSADYLERIETMLEIGVPDPTLYNPDDEVIIGASGLDDDGNPIGGFAFKVEGDPSDNRMGPLPLVNRILGGAVRVRRIT
jgi:hypothetical protein